MKRTRMILGLVLVAALMMGITFSTYAFFTSEVKSNNNVFDTATLKMAGTGENNAIATMKLENIWPGEEGSRTGWIGIKNAGTMDLKYKVSAQNTEENAELYDRLYVKITRPSGAIAYEGKLNALSGYLMNSNLNVGKSETLTFKVTLDPNANDTLQNKYTMVSFVFDATQWDNTQKNWAKVYDSITPPKYVEESEVNYEVFEAGSGFIDLQDKSGYCVEVHTEKDFNDYKFKRLEISIYDEDDNLIRTVLGSQTLFDYEEILNACSVTIPKNDDTLWFGDNYWMMGSLKRNAAPSYAVVRATIENGDIHELRLDYAPNAQ